jgi:hypothetical protein
VRGTGARSGCAALSRSGDRRARLAGDVRERGRGEGRKEEKGRRAVGGACREAGRRSGGERAGDPGVAGERKGKADGWVPPVSCPGWKGGEASRRVARLGWAGLRGLARVRGRKGKMERAVGLGLRGPVGLWPTRGVRVYSLDLNLIGLFKFKSHTFESNKFESPIK